MTSKFLFYCAIESTSRCIVFFFFPLKRNIQKWWWEQNIGWRSRRLVANPTNLERRRQLARLFPTSATSLKLLRIDTTIDDVQSAYNSAKRECGMVLANFYDHKHKSRKRVSPFKLLFHKYMLLALTTILSLYTTF
ncbi:hypothetical protein AUEXF2481DRAFT_575858 [Aureobasidium subglaciale EXF-2481]|uniref:Uncharacterized protein n=1 Tax=Aureobasidium subglaciale (strain EXF-2481) TaxID=1043005 RepID=A0A074YTZ0_AURSE|nr:uncharacterized protein AUEXF2481DRAFT_575858 [Aureobasidium subglaciale EXF-2481]KEQ90326.1 hypothetical protein AUEXF2481DRAFT_575858 [Aureobasidium subglaciale EXF-2481]